MGSSPCLGQIQHLSTHWISLRYFLGRLTSISGQYILASLEIQTAVATMTLACDTNRTTSNDTSKTQPATSMSWGSELDKLLTKARKESARRASEPRVHANLATRIQKNIKPAPVNWRTIQDSDCSSTDSELESDWSFECHLGLFVAGGDQARSLSGECYI